MNETEGIEAYQASFDGEPGYLDWAAFGPLSPAVRSEMHADAELLGTGRRSSIDLVAERVDEARGLAAELLGASGDDVSLQPSTTHGLMQAIYGIDGGLIVGRRESSSLTVTTTRAAELHGRVVPQWIDPENGYVTPDAVREALTDETRALAVSLVDHRTGYRADLPALRELLGDDRLLIIDATQAFGMIDVDYAAADVVCGHGFTWLRAGRGTGFAWFGPRAQEMIAPVLSGVTGVEPDVVGDGVPRPLPGARGYSVSRADPLAAARLATSLREIRDVGVAAIESELADRARDVEFFADRYEIAVLTPREPERRAGIVTLLPRPQDAGPVAASLANHGLTMTTRGDIVRVSVHVGTGADTLRLFGDALAAFSYARVW